MQHKLCDIHKREMISTFTVLEKHATSTDKSTHWKPMDDSLLFEALKKYDLYGTTNKMQTLHRCFSCILWYNVC